MSVIVIGATSGLVRAVAKCNAIELMPVARAFGLLAVHRSPDADS